MNSSQNRKKPRRVNTLDEGKRIYIFCEGAATEPKYFKGFEKEIETNPVYKNLVHVEGVGADTLRVIQYAEKYVNDNQIQNAEIWCVYDKDSFPAQDFNAVSERAHTLNEQQDRVTYQVAWSNQCVEYWFVLHFDYYSADNDRKYYRAFLHAKFHDLGWQRYEKNNDDLFKIMSEKGNPKFAIKMAEKRLCECKGKTDSESAPATRVHLLVKELAKYLPSKLKVKYI